MSAAPARLEIRARSRAVDHGAASPAAPPATHDVLTVCDFGPELDKVLLRLNVARRDPWFFRAAEVSAGTRFGTDRPRVCDKLLQLFGLVHLGAVQGKLGLRGSFEWIVLSTAREAGAGSDGASGDDERLDAALLTGKAGRDAAERLRHQFVAGNAAGLLAHSGYRLGPLLQSARRRR